MSRETKKGIGWLIYGGDYTSLDFVFLTWNPYAPGFDGIE